MTPEQFLGLQVGDRVQKICPTPYAHTVTKIEEDVFEGEVLRTVTLGRNTYVSNIFLPVAKEHPSHYELA